MICGVAASEEIFVLPGSAYGEEDRDFAVAFVIRRDIPGLTIVEARRPSDGREFEDGFDIPETGITQAYLIFRDVFIPQERVFLCGEYQFTGNFIKYFTANYRACIGACVAGQGDVMIGAAILMARANGLSDKVFTGRITDMIINNETTFGLGAGAVALGSKHEAGVWVSNPLLAHTNKIHVASLPYLTKRICQEIGGGAVETGCFPASDDFHHPEYSEVLQEAVKGASGGAEERARIIRLAEWLTLGAGVPGCMHGGGSPDGARLVVKNETPLEDYVRYAGNIAGLSEIIEKYKIQTD
jgi:4-hydroxybutyryl-CoA dehydratase/vinylacetyl-CoA-Delta-isomerase